MIDYPPFKLHLPPRRVRRPVVNPLAGVPARRAKAARGRLQLLKFFWAAEAARPGITRGRVAADTLKARRKRGHAVPARKTLFVWEQKYRSGGLAALVSRKGRPSRGSTPRQASPPNPTVIPAHARRLQRWRQRWIKRIERMKSIAPQWTRRECVKLATDAAKERGEAAPSFTSINRWQTLFDRHGMRGLLDKRRGRPPKERGQK